MLFKLQGSSVLGASSSLWRLPAQCGVGPPRPAFDHEVNNKGCSRTRLIPGRQQRILQIDRIDASEEIPIDKLVLCAFPESHTPASQITAHVRRGWGTRDNKTRGKHVIFFTSLEVREPLHCGERVHRSDAGIWQNKTSTVRLEPAQTGRRGELRYQVNCMSVKPLVLSAPTRFQSSASRRPEVLRR